MEVERNWGVVWVFLVLEDIVGDAVTRHCLEELVYFFVLDLHRQLIVLEQLDWSRPLLWL